MNATSALDQGLGYIGVAVSIEPVEEGIENVIYPSLMKSHRWKCNFTETPANPYE